MSSVNASNESPNSPHASTAYSSSRSMGGSPIRIPPPVVTTTSPQDPRPTLRHPQTLDPINTAPPSLGPPFGDQISAVPLSPRAILSILEQHASELKKGLLVNIAKGLCTTALRRGRDLENARTLSKVANDGLARYRQDIEKKQARLDLLESQRRLDKQQLEDLARKFASYRQDQAVPQGGNSEPPEGFEENHGRLPAFAIPIDNTGHQRVAPFIQFINSSIPCAAGTLGGEHDPVHITDLYAQPNYTPGQPNKPLPDWLIGLLGANSTSFGPFYERVRQANDDWGLLADLARHHHDDVSLEEAFTRRRELQAEIDGLVHSLSRTRERLAAANATERLAQFGGYDAEDYNEWSTNDRRGVRARRAAGKRGRFPL
jgi:hypothetical protein